MIPTCISSDREAAASVNRKTLSMYVGLPNYRNYWKSVGYKNEMERIEVALSKKDYASLPSLMTDKWLEDVSLFGSVSEVKEGIEKWYETGLETPILVPSSTNGGQFKAFEELFDLFT
jgi:alkanesulfonate monooxygenase SsuD/methylene tetrahydromethanopterin reductase-like flavin-dependent oxidoreductase (luciferase family)